MERDVAQTFYAQSDSPSKTLTVGQLIERLQAFDRSAPVIFKSPLYGCFGSNAAYSIDDVSAVMLERHENHIPATTVIDEESGEVVAVESETQVFHAWSGVVIA
jgi:hypothetical protein